MLSHKSSRRRARIWRAVKKGHLSLGMPSEFHIVGAHTQAACSEILALGCHEHPDCAQCQGARALGSLASQVVQQINILLSITMAASSAGGHHQCRWPPRCTKVAPNFGQKLIETNSHNSRRRWVSVGNQADASSHGRRQDGRKQADLCGVNDQVHSRHLIRAQVMMRPLEASATLGNKIAI